MYDIAIIGAGISGSAIARELSRYDLNTVILERGSEVCQGTTKANSAIVHGGYDAPPNSLKAKLNVRGNEMYEDLCRELNVEYKNIGSLVIGFNEDDKNHIQELYDRGIKNNVKGLKILSKDEILSIEPNINKNVTSALLCSSAGIVCPFNLNVALVENAVVNGVKLKLNAQVINIEKKEDRFEVKLSSNEIIKSKMIINAAGVYADKINNMIGGNEYYIIPRKGEYKILDKTEGKKANHVIFRCPTSKGKGVLVTQTVHGNLLVGPNATVVDNKEDTSTTVKGMNEITIEAKDSIEDIDFSKTITSFAGLRATSNTHDFMIFESSKCSKFINVGGIESPGLASAPGIAEYVLNIVRKSGMKLEKKEDFNPIREKIKPFSQMSREEQMKIIEKDSRHKKIICRCESITEGEIVDAINRPCGARTVDGIKRRVRPGMGRCQGGFCGPKVIEIIARELNMDIQDVLKDYSNSNMVIGKVKELRGETVEI